MSNRTMNVEKERYLSPGHLQRLCPVLLESSNTVDEDQQNISNSFALLRRTNADTE